VGIVWERNRGLGVNIREEVRNVGMSTKWVSLSVSVET
jgi:hypothetical protein